MLPISLFNVSLKDKVPHITTISLSHKQHYPVIPEHNLMISLCSIFPNDFNNVFSGFLFKSRPKPSPHCLWSLGFFTSVSLRALVGHTGSSPVLPLLLCSLLDAHLCSLLLSPGQSHTMSTLSTSPCPAPAQHGLCHGDPGTQRSLFSAVL